MKLGQRLTGETLVAMLRAMKRLQGNEVDEILARRAVVLLVADEGTETEIKAPGEYGDRVSKRVRDAIDKALTDAPHVELFVAHRLKSGTAVGRWGLGKTPLSAAVVVDGAVAWHGEVPLNETGATGAVRALGAALAKWPADAEEDRAAEAAVTSAEAHVADGSFDDAVDALFGPTPHTQLPVLRDEAWRDRALETAARALAGAGDPHAATMLLEWDARAERPQSELAGWLDVLGRAHDRRAAEKLLARWAERFPDAPEVALGQAHLLLSVGDAYGALEACRRAAEAGEPTRETWRLELAALRRLRRCDEAMTALAQLRHFGGWTQEDEAAYAELRDAATPASLEGGRGRERDVFAELGDGARRLGRGLLALVRASEGRLPFRQQVLDDAPQLLRPTQVDAALAEIEADPLLSDSSHASLYWLWRADGEVLDTGLDGETPAETAAPEANDFDPPRPTRTTARGTATVTAEAVDALATFASWFREDALAPVLGEARVHAARTTRWALQARSAGADPRLVTAYECAAREEAARAEALDAWIDSKLKGDDADRAHAGWQAAAESPWVPVRGLASEAKALRRVLARHPGFTAEAPKPAP